MKAGDRNRLGQWGEEVAAQYLCQRGHQLLATRFRCREGEIDLVTINEPYLCFVEVKLRSSRAFAEAREFVTPSKQRKIRLAALRYLQQYPSTLQPRFDVVEVYAPQGEQTKYLEIHLWENAF